MTVPSVDQVVTAINQLQSIVELVSYKSTYIRRRKTQFDSLFPRYRRATSSPGTHG